MRGVVLRGNFEPAGRPLDPNSLTVNRVLDDYAAEIEKRGFTGNAVHSFIKAFRAAFGEMTFAQVAVSSTLVERWMESMRERDVPLSHTTTRTRHVIWTPRTWNSYRSIGCPIVQLGTAPQAAADDRKPLPPD